MGFRFGKSINLGGGARVNLSRSGVGLSVGGKGGRVGIGPRGGYSSLNIPGTGISYGGRTGGGRSRGARAKKGGASRGAAHRYGSVGSTSAWAVFGVVVTVVVAIAQPVAGMAVLGAWLLWRSRPKQKAKRLARRALSMVKQNPAAAMSLLEEAHKLFPENDQILYLAGAASHDAEDFKMSARFLGELRRRVPEAFRAELLLGHAYFRTGEHDRAIEVLQQIPEESEDHTKALLLMGTVFSQREDYESAVETFRRGPLRKRKLDEDLKELHYQLATHYEHLGDKAAAKRHYRRVYTTDVGYRDVNQRLHKLGRGRTRED